MIRLIKEELLQRAGLISVSLFTAIMLATVYANEILLIVIQPIKEIHSDWHNEIVSGLINNAFVLYDSIQAMPQSRNSAEFDYLPTIEINIKASCINSTAIKVTASAAVIIWYFTIRYQIVLYSKNSLYSNEKKRLLHAQAENVILICCSLVCTQCLWTYMYMSVSLHNYNEYNYYEFDVDFDVNEYTDKYLLSIVLHFVALITKNRYLICMTLALCIATNIIQYLETGYFACIATCSLYIKKTCNTWTRALSSTVHALYLLLEHYVIRVYRNCE